MARSNVKKGGSSGTTSAAKTSLGSRLMNGVKRLAGAKLTYSKGKGVGLKM